MKRSMARHLVFVYGTLKKGQPNHTLMQKPENGLATHLGNGRTANQFPLVIASEYNIPFMLIDKGKGKRVKGEIYEVCDNMVKALDELESHPEFYERLQTSIHLETDTDGNKLDPRQPKECWCYFLTDFKPKLLDLPQMDEYDCMGPHGLVYNTHIQRNESNYDLKGDVKFMRHK